MRRARMESAYPGDTQIEVFAGKNKTPHFIISGAEKDNLNPAKVTAYLNECDWTDRGAKGYIIPTLRCDDFLKD